MSEHRIIAIAAGVTFYLLLAIFPAMAALVALYGLFAQPSEIAQHVADLSNVLPGGAAEVIDEQLTRISSQSNGTLGFAFLFGLAVSLWSANAGMKAIFDALNVVYGEKEKRSFVRLNLISLAFTVGAIVFMLLVLAAVAVIPLVAGQLGLSQLTHKFVAIGKWPLLVVAVALANALIYRHGPSRRQAGWHWVTWGSMSATVCWLAVSVLFSWYAANFGSYNKTYGSLGAVIGFMTWIWLSTIIILLGAELDAELDRQSASNISIDRERNYQTAPPDIG